MGPSASQSLAEDDGSHQSIFNESSWLPGSCPRSPAKKSMDSIKSESMLASKNNSDLVSLMNSFVDCDLNEEI